MQHTFFLLKAWTLNIRIARRLMQHAFLLLTILVFAGSTSARLKIDITEGVEGGVPVVVIPFANENRDMPRTYSAIIASDLAYSGLFSIVNPAVVESLNLPSDSSDTYTEWSAKGVEKIVSGRIEQDEEGNENLEVSLFDVVVGKKVAVWSIRADERRASSIAHYLSDLIYEELTGVIGIFSTRLAFVSSERTDFRKRRYHLNVADADGHNIVRVFSSDNPLMSPTWSPDRKRIAYISYENGNSELFIQELSSSVRESLLSEVGEVNSLDWSDDGSKLAYVSSRDGNAEIYIYDFPSSKKTRMTNNLAIDTEPSWAPNNTLYFTSDRSGSPQIYRIAPSDDGPQRITFEGSYNSDLDVSPRGDKIVYVSGRKDKFTIVIRDLASQQEAILSSGNVEERPRFAPNGQLLSYLTQDSGQSALGLLTIDGIFGKLIPLDVPHLRAIAWSPTIVLEQ